MRLQSVKITPMADRTSAGDYEEGAEIHLQNDYGATGASTACGIVDPTEWIVEYVDDPPDCEKCIAVARFFRNLRCIDGSVPTT
jgi:hypothetical protein